MESIRDKKESPPRNLKSHLEETVIAMSRVEGEKWKQEQEGWDRDNIVGALSWLDDIEKDLPNYVVFGASGLNRWIVNLKGDVSLLRSSSDNRHLEMAKQEGFQVI